MLETWNDTIRRVLSWRIQRAIIEVSTIDRWRNALILFHKKLIFENIIFITLISNFDMQKCQGVSPSIGHRDIYYNLLNSSRQGTSNDSRFMSLASLDGKLFAFYFLEFFENNFLSIDSKDVIRLPFDASRHGESNELRFVIFWSLNGEIMHFKTFLKKLPGDFWLPTVYP